MKAIILSGLFILLLCGCFRKSDKFNTLQDYSRTFSARQKISVKEKKHLTLQEAEKIALSNNPTLHAAASAIRAAQYSYYRSLSAWFPEISASWKVENTHSRGYNLHHPPAGIFPSEERFSDGGTIRASWLLFNGLARELDIIIAELEYDKSTAAAEDVKRLLLRALSYIWCDILLASEKVIIFNADKAFQDAALRQAQQQFKSGHISYSAVLNFKILSSKASSRIALAEYERKTALNTLSALLGYNSSELPPDIRLHPILAEETRLNHPLHFYLEQAVLNRPDLRAEKIQYEKSLREKQSVYASFMPEVHLFADFSFGSAAAEYGNSEVKRSYYNQPSFSYGLTGTWNIFRGFASLSELRRRQALERAALWGLNKKYLEVTAEVSDALDHCRNTLLQIKIYRDMANWVLEQRNLIYSEYINGRETIARLNQSQSELIEAQNNLALWKIQYHKASAQLKAALGTDSFSHSSEHKISCRKLEKSVK